MRKSIRTPTILQMEATECGAVALGIVLAYYHCYIPLEELRITCGVSRNGSRANNILKAARAYGLNAQGAEGDIEAIKMVKCPMIVHWGFKHFIVVEGFTKDDVYVNDPAYGRKKMAIEEFNRHYTGVVITLEPGPHFIPKGNKPSLWKSLRHRLQHSNTDIAFIFLTSLALVIPGILIPVFSKVFIDDVLIKGYQDWFQVLALGMLITALLRWILSYLQRKYLLKLQLKLLHESSTHFMHHLFHLPLPFFEQRYAGDIEERANANNNISSVLSSDLTANLFGVVSILFYGVVMLLFSFPLTMIGMVSAAFNGLILFSIQRKIKEKYFLLKQIRAKKSSLEKNGIQLIETLKSSGLESHFLKRYLGLQAKVVNAEQKLGYFSQWLSTLPQLVSGISQLSILGVGCYQIFEGNLSVGTLVAFQSLLSSFNAPLNTLLQSSSKLPEISADVARLQDVLNYKSEYKSEYKP